MIASKEQKSPTLLCFIVHCSCEESEDCISEAERLWIVGKKLIDEGVVDKITCLKIFKTAKIRFLFLNELNNETIINICDEIQEEAQVFRFICIIGKNIFYRFSPEKELLSSPEDYKEQKAKEKNHDSYCEYIMCD